jgi:hypothetical protein
MCQACCSFTLGRQGQQGHLCIPRGTSSAAACGLLQLGAASLPAAARCALSRTLQMVLPYLPAALPGGGRRYASEGGAVTQLTITCSAVAITCNTDNQATIRAS